MIPDTATWTHVREAFLIDAKCHISTAIDKQR